jgi:hypothetical protein
LTEEQTDREKWIKECDAILFVSYEEGEEMHTAMTYYRVKGGDKIEQFNELGHKFNIMLFRDSTDIDMFSAILGDPEEYAKGVGRMGYHGLIFKQKAQAKKELTNLFVEFLSKLGLSDSQIEDAIQQTVN